MMKMFRKSAMKKWGMFIASFIMLTFMLWGGQTYLLESSRSKFKYAGKAFGRNISFEEFQKNLKQVEVLARLQYGENFRKVQEMLNLDSQAWDRILLLREAHKRHATVSDADVITAVEGITKIQIDSPMVRQNYENFVQRQLGVLPRVFEEGVRDSLKISRVYDQETAQVTVTDKDVADAFRQKNDKIQISYATFPTEELKNQIPFDEAKAQEFFNAHKDDFLMPPTVEVEFFQIDLPKTKAAATPEKTATKSDDKNVTSVPADDADDATWEKTDALYSEIAGGKNFAQVAKDNGLTVQVSEPFTMEQPILKPGWTFPLVKKMFQAKVGEVLEPVGTPDGFQILRVKSKKDAYEPTYTDVKDKVKETWLTMAANELSQKKADAARKTVVMQSAQFKNPDFVQIAKGLNLDLQQTPAFGRGEYLPTIGVSKDFQDAAFRLTRENPLSDVVATPKGYAFLHLDNVVAADMKEFDKEKPKLREELLAEKKAAVFSDFLIRLRIQANLEDNMAKIKASQQKTQ